MKISVIGSLITVLFFVIEGADFKRIRLKRQDQGCTLPPYPDHGTWEVLNGVGDKPRDKVPLNTLLTFSCSRGYKLTAASPYVICDAKWSINNMPQCEKLCEPYFSTPTTTLTCRDKNKLPIECSEAADGSYLSYSCVAYYEIPLGYKKEMLCLNGRWTAPKPICQPVCGKKVNDDAVSLIAKGTPLKTIKYPWITALYQNDGGEYVNICGGSILSRKVVVTAAHCVTNDYGDAFPHHEFKIAVGKLWNKYQDTRDKKAEYHDLEKIIVNDQYKGESRHYLGDMALLVVQKVMKLGPLVQPVCFSGLTDIYLHVGLNGEVAGWGNTEDDIPSDEMRFLEIPYKYDMTCAHELPKDWADRYNIIDKMCAGFVNQSKSICKGDSGSGLVFRNSEDNRYYIHGVASLAPKNADGRCNRQQNSLYTKVAIYYEFIDREISQYQVEDCQLPEYPKNGIYVVEGRATRKPGEIVYTTDLLRIDCKEGYIASSTLKVSCESSLNLPTCQKLCPTPHFPQKTIYSCKNSRSQQIDCSDSTEGSTLIYTCPEGYTMAPNSPTTRVCAQGTWGTPKPECLRIELAGVVPATTTQSPIADSGKKVLCAYGSWSSYVSITPEILNPFLCTHIYYAFAGIWETGKMRVEDEELDLKGGLYRRVTNLKSKNTKLKVILSVGGTAASNSSLFSSLAADPAKIQAFITSTIYYVEAYNFDGVNIDWHFPEPSDKENYVKLIRAVKNAFKEKGLLVTAAARSDFEGTGYDVAKMNEILDWVIIKTYDFYGGWSTFTGQHTGLYPHPKQSPWEQIHLTVDGEVDNWVKAGMSKDKLAISVAFHARTFKLKDKRLNGIHELSAGVGPGEGLVEFVDLCTKYKNWTTVWNDEQKSVYAYKEDEWMGWDSKDAIWSKGTYVKEKGLLGVYIWSIDKDDVLGDCGGMKQVQLKHLNGGLGHKVNWGDD